MGIRSLLGGIEELSFKRTPEGWVFQSPSVLTPFGRGTHYLVSDAQKEAIAARLRRIWIWTLVLIMVASGSLPIVINALHVPQLEGAVARGLVYGGVIMLITLGIVFWQVRATRPLLAGAQPTMQRISLADRFRTQIAVSPTWYFVALTLFMIALCGSAISEVVASEGIAFFGWLLCAVVLTGLAVYSAALLVLKLRSLT